MSLEKELPLFTSDTPRYARFVRVLNEEIEKRGTAAVVDALARALTLVERLGIQETAPELKVAAWRKRKNRTYLVASLADLDTVVMMWRGENYGMYAVAMLAPAGLFGHSERVALIVSNGEVRVTWSHSSTMLEGGWTVRMVRRVLDAMGQAGGRSAPTE